MASEPTLDDYVAIGRIYSGNRLSKEELLQQGQKHQQENCYTTLTLGIHSYLRHEFNVPLTYWKEIL